MKKIKIVFRIVCFSILAFAVFQIAFLAPAQSAEGENLTNAELLKNFKDHEDRSYALDQRERVIEEKETRLKEREAELEKKIAKMEELRMAVTGELEGQRKNNEEKVLKMVAVFETMTPKSAAAVLETIDDWLAVEVLKKMDVKRVAKVMNTMDKNRSAKLSEILTGYYNPTSDRKISSQPGQGGATKGITASAPAQSNVVKKGGEK